MNVNDLSANSEIRRVASLNSLSSGSLTNSLTLTENICQEISQENKININNINSGIDDTNLIAEMMDSGVQFESPYKFWEHIYCNYIHPKPTCTCCSEEINQPSTWISFTCKCQKYYHKQCIYNNFDVLICPDCRESKQIYAFPKFLCKFMEAEEYYKIYKSSIEGKSSYETLKIYKLWFQTFSIYTPPFLNLYDHIKVHNPYTTIEYLEGKKNTHHIECFDPAFTMEDDGMTYNTDMINYYNKQVFVDIGTFKNRFEEYCYNLIDDTFPYEDHVVVAAGAVHKCLESRIKMDKIPQYSNIDILISHPDIKIVTRDSKRVFKYLQDRHGDNIYWVRILPNVMRMYVPGYNRMIQIIMFKNTIENVVSKFDFSHVQYIYDGKTIKTTLPGLEYANYLVTTHDGYYDINFPKRFQKMRDLNLCIALPMADSMVINIPKSTGIQSWYPNYTDDLDLVQAQIKAISGVKAHYVTKGKPCRILYTKIPEEYSHNRFTNGAQTEDDIINYIENESQTNLVNPII
jgi:hypothetical protein